MYIYDRRFSDAPSLLEEQLLTSQLAQRHSYYPERVVSEFLGRVGPNSRYVWVNEGLGQSTSEEKLKYLSFLPHFTLVDGQYTALTPSVMDPKIYDGPANYKIAPKLLDCLKNVMKKPNLRPIKVALVDLTKGLTQPEFAGSYDCNKQMFVASVAKLAAMLAAFQLREDLRAAWKIKGAKPLVEIYKGLQDDWAATQTDPGGRATPFTRGISLRGKLVFRNGAPVRLKDLKSPRLPFIFRPMVAPGPIEFGSTAESKAQLDTIVDEFMLRKEYKARDEAKKEWAAAALKDAATRAAAKKKLAEAEQELAKASLTKQPEGKRKFDALGFWERLGITVAGASDYAASTIVRDVGFPYIASTLLQSGLYDPNRGGGLWLGHDYRNIFWESALAGGDSISATAGSLAAFMTLLAQGRLVSSEASGIMRGLIQKVPYDPKYWFPGFGSWFETGLGQIGGLKKLLSKVGLARGHADECAYIEREVNDEKGGKIPLRYVAVGLRAEKTEHLQELIIELDKCILANNGL
jgi:hypothetical protein